MTQDGGDKLDRIEAALDELRQRQENTQQQLDNQVAVNADLRISTTELRATAEALLQIVTLHQQNFERLTAELNADRQEWKAQIQLVQERAERDRLQWQAQIERIWQHLNGTVSE